MSGVVRAHLRVLALSLLLAPFAAPGIAAGEPLALAKQYARCSTCHYSPTGGGLLTPYGRALSQELSTVAAHGGTSSPPAATTTSVTGEPAFLWGALGDRLGPLNLGVDIRPSRLELSFPGGSSGMNLLMNFDGLAAFRRNGWTVYGELGRRPTISGGGIYSYEVLGEP